MTHNNRLLHRYRQRGRTVATDGHFSLDAARGLANFSTHTLPDWEYCLLEFIQFAVASGTTAIHVGFAQNDVVITARDVRLQTDDLRNIFDPLLDDSRYRHLPQRRRLAISVSSALGQGSRRVQLECSDPQIREQYRSDITNLTGGIPVQIDKVPSAGRAYVRGRFAYPKHIDPFNDTRAQEALIELFEARCRYAPVKLSIGQRYISQGPDTPPDTEGRPDLIRKLEGSDYRGQLYLLPVPATRAEREHAPEQPSSTPAALATLAVVQHGVCIDYLRCVAPFPGAHGWVSIKGVKRSASQYRIVRDDAIQRMEWQISQTLDTWAQRDGIDLGTRLHARLGPPQARHTDRMGPQIGPHIELQSPELGPISFSFRELQGFTGGSLIQIRLVIDPYRAYVLATHHDRYRGGNYLCTADLSQLPPKGLRLEPNATSHDSATARWHWEPGYLTPVFRQLADGARLQIASYTQAQTHTTTAASEGHYAEPNLDTATRELAESRMAAARSMLEVALTGHHGQQAPRSTAAPRDSCDPGMDIRLLSHEDLPARPVESVETLDTLGRFPNLESIQGMLGPSAGTSDIIFRKNCIRAVGRILGLGEIRIVDAHSLAPEEHDSETPTLAMRSSELRAHFERIKIRPDEVYRLALFLMPICTPQIQPIKRLAILNRILDAYDRGAAST